MVVSSRLSFKPSDYMEILF